MIPTAKQVDEITNWISAPRYRDIYERVKRDKHPGSGQDLLRMPRYLAWRDAEFRAKNWADVDSLKEDWLQRVLFIQGRILIQQVTDLANRHS